MPRRLHRTQIIPRPVDEVFPFFADAANLQTITPDFMSFRIVTPLPVEMKEGALIDYKIRLFGLPTSWRTRIERWEPGRRFVDVQLRGPYRLWHHTHEFESVPEGTRMTDTVDYELPLGPLGGIAHALFVGKTLDRIFDYRLTRIAELFPAR